MLIAFATRYFRSNTLSSANCSTRKRPIGAVEYFRTLLIASIGTPGHNRALPLAPQFVKPQDGHDKQDSVSRAARRWLAD